MEIKFYGGLHYDDFEVMAVNPVIAISAVKLRYPNFKKEIVKKQICYQLDGDILHVFPKATGSAVGAVIGVVNLAISIGKALRQKRVAKKNKKKADGHPEAYLFETAISSDVQGGAMPLVFGEAYTGGIVINNELEAK